MKFNRLFLFNVYSYNCYLSVSKYCWDTTITFWIQKFKKGSCHQCWCNSDIHACMCLYRARKLLTNTSCTFHACNRSTICIITNIVRFWNASNNFLAYWRYYTENAGECNNASCKTAGNKFFKRVCAVTCHHHCQCHCFWMFLNVQCWPTKLYPFIHVKIKRQRSQKRSTVPNAFIQTDVSFKPILKLIYKMCSQLYSN